MKTNIQTFEGIRIKKLVITKGPFGLRWKITLANKHVIYPLDGWKTRKEALEDFEKETS